MPGLTYVAWEWGLQGAMTHRHIAWISSARGHALLSHQTSFTKQKSKDNITKISRRWQSTIKLSWAPSDCTGHMSTELRVGRAAPFCSPPPACWMWGVWWWSFSSHLGPCGWELCLGMVERKDQADTFLSLALGHRNFWIPCKLLGGHGKREVGPLAQISSYPATSSCECWAIFWAISAVASQGAYLRPGLGKLHGPGAGHLIVNKSFMGTQPCSFI